MKKYFSSRLHFYGLGASLAVCILLILPNLVPEAPRDSWIRSPVKRYEGPVLTWAKDRIHRGDTFAALMQNFDIGPAEVDRIVRAAKPIFNLTRLRAGTFTAAAHDEDGVLREWRYEFDPEHTFVLRFPEEGELEPLLLDHPFERRIEGLHATIQDSLYRALTRDNRNNTLPLQVAEMFGWSVDFYFDLRKGDSVDVVYERLYQNDAPYGTGRVLSATLVLSGKAHQAFFYENGDVRGYYDVKGQSLKKQFLRSPLKYGRVTSGYTSRRFHPVLKRYKPHYGVDYGAPTGTSIRATADGTVVKATRGKGEGRYVVLRHANRYETMYLHMSRFARGIRSGKRVHQGQTIGYVGSSGYATGPHVDYRMKIAGRYVNPRKTTLPPAPPLPSSEKTLFASHVQRLSDAMAQLLKEDGLSQNLALAVNEPQPVSPNNTNSH